MKNVFDVDLACCLGIASAGAAEWPVLETLAGWRVLKARERK